MALNNELSVNLGLPDNPLTQDAELFTELKRVYNALRSLARANDLYSGVVGEQDDFLDQVGVSRCYFGVNSKIYLECGEDISYSNTVGIKSDGKAWKAIDGSVRARGFCSTPGTTLTGSFIEVQLVGIYPPFPAATLTAGSTYYQSGTAGLIGAAGSQAVGFAISDTHLFFMPTL